jgi:hypothetical protein
MDAARSSDDAATDAVTDAARERLDGDSGPRGSSPNAAQIDPFAVWPRLQRSPWTPSPSEPSDATVRALFEGVLPDPRGLPYVRARVIAGDLWSGEGRPVAMRGWLGPRAGQGSERWVLGWTGIWYRAIATLGDGSLSDDLALVTGGAQPATRGDAAREPSEAYSLLPSSSSAIALALARRLGATLAPTQQAALSWVEHQHAHALYERAILAHMRGDADDALLLASRLLAVTPAPAEEPDEDDAPALTFRFGAEVLIEDDARRVRARCERVSRSSVCAALSRAATAPVRPLVGPPRVRELIQALDEVDARQQGQPGGVDLASDPRVEALITLGEPAVDGLIDAIENDARMTRSVHFWRDFHYARTVLSVRECAYVALASILQRDFFRAGFTGDNLTSRGAEAHRALAARIRSYWAARRDLSRHERELYTLTDDHSAPDEWVQSAVNLVRPADEVTPRASMLVLRFAQRGTGPMLGEPLRSRTSPSLTELFARRIDGLLRAAAAHAHDSPEQYDLRRAACELSGALVAWEPRAAPLRAVSAQWTATLGSDATHAECAFGLLAERDARGDVTALDDYVRWAATVNPGRATVGGNALDVAVRHATDPRVVTLTDAVLTRGRWLASDDAEEVARWLSRGAVALPAMQRFLEAQLSDRTRVGALELSASGCAIRTASALFPVRREACARSGATDWRACDDFAWRLLSDPFRNRSTAERLIVPVAERDRLLAQWRTAIRAARLPWSL